MHYFSSFRIVTFYTVKRVLIHNHSKEITNCQSFFPSFLLLFLSVLLNKGSLYDLVIIFTGIRLMGPTLLLVIHTRGEYQVKIKLFVVDNLAFVMSCSSCPHFSWQLFSLISGNNFHALFGDSNAKFCYDEVKVWCIKCVFNIWWGLGLRCVWGGGGEHSSGLVLTVYPQFQIKICLFLPSQELPSGLTSPFPTCGQSRNVNTQKSVSRQF